MLGISLIWVLATTAALVAISACAPAGPKAAFKEAVSEQFYWSGAFLTLVCCMFSLLLWYWRLELQALIGEHYSIFYGEIWTAFVSAVFGGFLWVLVALAATGRFNLKWMLVTGLFLSMILLVNYVPAMKTLAISFSPILGSEDVAINLVATIVLGTFLIAFIYAYFVFKERLTISSSRRLRRS